VPSAARALGGGWFTGPPIRFVWSNATASSHAAGGSSEGTDGWNADRAGFRLDWDATERDEVNLSGKRLRYKDRTKRRPPFPLPIRRSGGGGASRHGGDTLFHMASRLDRRFANVPSVLSRLGGKS
jgi:hypothetical protein